MTPRYVLQFRSEVSPEVVDLTREAWRKGMEENNELLFLSPDIRLIDLTTGRIVADWRGERSPLVYATADLRPSLAWLGFSALTFLAGVFLCWSLT